MEAIRSHDALQPELIASKVCIKKLEEGIVDEFDHKFVMQSCILIWI